MRCLLYSLLFFLTGFAQQIPFPQDTIVRNDLFNNREFPAYDSQGRIHLSYTGQNGTASETREIYYVEEDAQGNFSTINISNNSVDDNYSTLSIDKNDKVHIGFEGRDAGNLFQIKYTNNISGSFFNPIYITSGGLNKATPFSKIGPDSVMYFVYFTYTDPQDYIYYTTFDLRDSTISSPINLGAGETGGDFDAALDFDTSGNVHVVMKLGSLFGGPLKYMNNNSGSLVEVQTGVTASITNPKIAIDKNNVVYIIYRNETDKRLYIINNSAGSFSAPLAITPAGQRPAFAQNFAIDNEGRIYVTYQSSVAASGKGFYFVYAENNIFSDTMLVYDLTSEYVTRNSSAVIAKGNGDFALFYAPGGVRNTLVVCDIFMKRGNISEVPVELTFFTSAIINNTVRLEWSTATEKNNKGFFLERSRGNSMREMIAFVEGKGTTSEVQNYYYNDVLEGAGKYFYRLIQVDYSGKKNYYGEIEVDFNIMSSFLLEQNYPNPFNPETRIDYYLSDDCNVKLMLYNSIGKEVSVLINEQKSKGNYSYLFNSDKLNLASGIYYYRMTAGEFNSVKKIILVK